jgi:hypothetical protein
MSSLFSSMSDTVTESVGKNGSPRVFLIGGLVIAVIVFVVLLWYFWPRTNDSTVVGPFVLSATPKLTSALTVFTQSQITKSLGNNFSLGFFVYMDKLNEARIPFAGSPGDYRIKPFLNILGVGSISVDPIHQEVRFSVNTTSPEFGKKADLTVDAFAIARWNQVLITVEGRTVDMYVNGALRQSILLSNIPVWTPVGVLLETSPDFSGQAGLFQAWPHRLSESAVMKNYKRNTDTRGKPHIPDKEPSVSDILSHMKINLCKFGFCSKPKVTNPTEYVEYQYA